MIPRPGYCFSAYFAPMHYWCPTCQCSSAVPFAWLSVPPSLRSSCLILPPGWRFLGLALLLFVAGIDMKTDRYRQYRVDDKLDWDGVFDGFEARHRRTLCVLVDDPPLVTRGIVLRQILKFPHDFKIGLGATFPPTTLRS